MPIPSTRRTDDAGPIVARRFDYGGELLRPVRRESDGAMLFEGTPVREGILLYRNADGTERRELVTRQAVEDSARTLARAPVTLEHPEEGFVTAETVQDLGVGDVDGSTSVEVDELGGFARVKLAVRRQDAIDAIANGKRELSPGYDVTLDETPGEDPIHGRYDARQIGRECNHLAIVDRGRGGSTVRLRTDADDRVQVGRVDPPSPAPNRRTDTEARPMRNLLTLLAALGIEQRYDTDEAAVDAAIPVARKLRADAQKRADAEEGENKSAEELEALKADMEAKAGELKELQDKYDEMKKAKEDMEEEAEKKADAAELSRLQAVADQIRVDHDGLDLKALRIALAKTRVDSLPDDASSDRIDGILDIVCAEAGTTSDDRWDWSDKRADDDKSAGRKRAEPAPFRNPYLDAADEARTGGQQ